MFDRIFKLGVAALFGGARRGQPALTAVGAAVVIVGWLRRRATPRSLLFGENLKEGESLQITFRRGASVVDRVRVEG